MDKHGLINQGYPANITRFSLFQGIMVIIADFIATFPCLLPVLPCLALPCSFSKIVYQYKNTPSERLFTPLWALPGPVAFWSSWREEVWMYWEVIQSNLITYFSNSYFSAYVCRWFFFSKSFIGGIKKVVTLDGCFICYVKLCCPFYNLW